MALASATKKAIRETIELAEKLDPIGKKASAIGMSAEQLQVFQGALGLAGVEASKTSKMFLKMQANLGAAFSEGGPMLDMIEKMGISLDDLQAADAGERFLMLADGMSRAEDRAIGLDQAKVLLGKSAMDMFGTIEKGRPVLEGLVDTMKGYGVASNQTVADAEAMNDAMAQFQAVGFALKTQVLGPLMPMIEGLALALGDVMKGFMGTGREVETASRVYSNLLAVLFIPQWIKLAGSVHRTGMAMANLLSHAHALSLVMRGRWLDGATAAYDAFSDTATLNARMVANRAIYEEFANDVAQHTSDAYQRSLARVSNVIPDSLRRPDDPDGGGGGGGGGKSGGKRGPTEAELALEARKAALIELAKLTGDWDAVWAASQLDRLDGVALVTEAERRELAALEEQYLALDRAMTGEVHAGEDLDLDVFADQLTAEQEYENMRTEIKRSAAAERKVIEDAASEHNLTVLAEETAERNRQAFLIADQAMAVLNAFEGFSQAVVASVVDTYGEGSKEAEQAQLEMFHITQAVALAQAIVNTALAVTSALAVQPFPLGIALAVGAGIAGAIQIGTIVATSVAGVGDAGITPDMLTATGGGRRTVLMRDDEMLIDPVGTRHVTEMLAAQSRGMSSSQPINTNIRLELDGRVLGQVQDSRLIRQQERGLAYENRVRQQYQR